MHASHHSTLQTTALYIDTHTHTPTPSSVINSLDYCNTAQLTSTHYTQGEVTSLTSGVTIWSLLWGNMEYCVKLSGENVSCYSNKIESVSLRNVHTILLRKWCHNSKRFAQLDPHHGRKTSWHRHGMKKLRHCIKKPRHCNAMCSKLQPAALKQLKSSWNYNDNNNNKSDDVYGAVIMPSWHIVFNEFSHRWPPTLRPSQKSEVKWVGFNVPLNTL